MVSVKLDVRVWRMVADFCSERAFARILAALPPEPSDGRESLEILLDPDDAANCRQLGDSVADAMGLLG